MPRRTQFFQQIPWSGGLNTAVDPGMIPPTDLQQADNVVFGTSGSRLKREGLEYLDTALPAVTYASLTSNVATLHFADAVDDGTDQLLVAGEKITITDTGSTGFAATAVAIASVAVHAVNFADGAVSIDPTNSINSVGHTYKTGVKGQLTTTGTLPAGLLTGTDYFVIKVDNDNFKLAISLVNAEAGTAVTISSASGGGTHTFTPTTHKNKITYALTHANISFAAVTSLTVARSANVIGIHDYWYFASNTKNQLLMTATSDGKLFSYNSSNKRTEITGTGGPTAPTKASMITFNEQLIVAFDGVGNTPIKYKPADVTYSALAATAPDCSILQLHLGRLWTNDKTNADRVHYCTTYDHTEWGGVGDSGAIDIGVGDGDAAGITAIFPSFKGRLFIAKDRSLHQLIGDAPETFIVSTVTQGIGCSSHQSVITVDQDDLVYMSKKGFHSVAATSNYGDFQGQFLSAKIQPTFNDFTAGTLTETFGAYNSKLNSVAWIVAETGSDPDTVYLYNTEIKAWHRWPDVAAQCLSTRLINDTPKFVFGTRDGRVIQSQRGTYTDYDSTGIEYRIKTGAIYPDNNPTSLKAFKKIGFLFKPLGRFSFTVKVKVDNFSRQSLQFEQTIEGAALDVDFTLGSSVLGVDQVLAPYWLPIDGIGHGVTVEIEQTGTNEQVDIYGIMIEYEPAGFAQETSTGS